MTPKPRAHLKPNTPEFDNLPPASCFQLLPLHDVQDLAAAAAIDGESWGEKETPTATNSPIVLYLYSPHTRLLANL